MSDITLNDIAIDTVFVRESDGRTYKKSCAGTFGEKGYTICYPKLGGVFQEGDKFKTKVNNSEKVSL